MSVCCTFGKRVLHSYSLKSLFVHLNMKNLVVQLQEKHKIQHPHCGLLSRYTFVFFARCGIFTLSHSLTDYFYCGFLKCLELMRTLFDMAPCCREGRCLRFDYHPGNDNSSRSVLTTDTTGHHRTWAPALQMF